MINRKKNSVKCLGSTLPVLSVSFVEYKENNLLNEYLWLNTVKD
jgi:hypothetical protein